MKSPPEVIVQEKYINDNISISKFDNCSIPISDITFKTTQIDNVTIYYVNTKNAIELINIEQSRKNCLKQYKEYTNMICNLDSIVCQ